MQFVVKHLHLLMLVLFLLKPLNLFGGQKLPARLRVKQETPQSSKLDRLTLALVDRLPTDSERELVQLHGFRGVYELANQLISNREFFDRLSLYLQSQLEQTPAWLWEAKSNSHWLFAPAVENPELKNRVVWYVKPSAASKQNTCTGLWTLLNEDQVPRMCRCEDLVDTLPVWDPSSAMRVCPIVQQDEHCGNMLQRCVPADARINPRNPHLAADEQSAGGRAITRLLTDLSLIQGRSLAAAIITHRRWSELTPADTFTVQSRSSLEIIRKWLELSQSESLKRIFISLNLGRQSQSLSDIFAKIPTGRAARQNQTQLESPAEELLLISGAHPHISFKPLRPTSLSQLVWRWNTQLLLTCQIPHFAPQYFSVPLPHPSLAKEGSYFCTSCHLSLDKTIENNPGTSSSNATTVAPIMPTTDATSMGLCAIDHAIQFVLGYRPTGESAEPYRRIGLQSYQANNENLSIVIRDLSLEFARRALE